MGNELEILVFFPHEECLCFFGCQLNSCMDLVLCLGQIYEISKMWLLALWDKSQLSNSDFPVGLVKTPFYESLGKVQR